MKGKLEGQCEERNKTRRNGGGGVVVHSASNGVVARVFRVRVAIGARFIHYLWCGGSSVIDYSTLRRITRIRGTPHSTVEARDFNLRQVVPHVAHFNWGEGLLADVASISKGSALVNYNERAAVICVFIKSLAPYG